MRVVHDDWENSLQMDSSEKRSRRRREEGGGRRGVMMKMMMMMMGLDGSPGQEKL